MAGDRDATNNVRYMTVLTAVVLAAIAVRAAGLASESFWCDEATSVAHAHESVPALLGSLAADDLPPPLYFLLLKAHIGVFGDSEGATRALSLLFGIAALPVAFALARRLFGTPVAVATAYLLALSPIHVYYAQEARAYTLLCLLCLLSILAFLRARERGRIRDWSVLALLNAALLYTHYSAIFFIACEGILPALGPERAGWRRRYFASLVLSFALFSPWMLQAFRQTASFQTGLPYHGWGEAHGLRLLRSFVILFYGPEALALCGVCLPGVIIFARKEKAAPVPVAAGLFLGPVLLLYAWSRLVMPIFGERFLLAVLPFGFMLMGAGMIGLSDETARRLSRPGLSRVLLCLFVLAFTVVNGKYIYNQWSRVDKVDMRPAAKLIGASARSDDLIVIIPDHHSPVLRYYWTREGMYRLLGQTAPINYVAPAKSIADRAVSARIEGRRIVIVYSEDPGGKAEALKKHFDEMLSLTESRMFPGVEVGFYE